MANKQPLRCFQGNAQPHEAFWAFKNMEDGGAAEMELYGYISEYSWLDDDITPKKFKDDLYRFGGGGPVVIRLNSPGGDVIAASVMRSILSEYPGEVSVQIEGIAASAAVMVAISGKTVRIMDSAYMMIHDPYVMLWMAQLDVATLGRLQDSLKSIKDGIVGAYANHTGMSQERISRMMADETWMSASEAVKFGFADEVIGGGQGKAKAIGYANALANYVNVPANLLNVQDEPVINREAERLRSLVQILK